MPLIRRILFFITSLPVVITAGAQCAYTCSNYIVSPITYSLFPTDGTQLYLLDDEVSTTLPLNFNFEFYCNTYNQVRVCSNGFITFDFSNINNAGTPYAQNLPHPASPNAVIAWNWNDLDPSTTTGGGTITYTTIGAPPNQKFIVTYSNVPIWTINSPPASTLLNTGQIVLYETTNIIEIHIKEATNNGWIMHSEGIEDDSGTNGLSVFVPPNQFRNQSLWYASYSSHMFSPYTITSSLSVTGTSSLCEGTQAIYSATAFPTPHYYNWIFPQGWSGSSASSTAGAIAGMPGTVSVTANYTCGASQAATIAVNVLPAPNITLSPLNNTVLCSGTVFSINASGAVAYTLHPGNITGGSSLTHTAITSTVYSISGSGPEGCVAVISPTVEIVVKETPTVTVNSGGICEGETFTMVPVGASSYTFSNMFNMVTPPAGAYSFSVTGSVTNDCVSQPAVSNLTVHPIPVVTITGSGNLICTGETVTLTAQGAFSYLWIHNSAVNPVLVEGPLQAMTYSVQGTDIYGCKHQARFTLFVSPCTGAGELVKETHAGNPVVFPNPSDGELFVSAISDIQVTIIDPRGKIVHNESIGKGLHKIDISFLRGGLYLLRMKGNGTLQSQVLIINH